MKELSNANYRVIARQNEKVNYLIPFNDKQGISTTQQPWVVDEYYM